MITNNLFSIWKAHEADLGVRLTLKEVSEATGIGIPTLSRWMNGYPTRFRSTTLKALAEYFDVGIDQLLIEVDEEGEEV